MAQLHLPSLVGPPDSRPPSGAVSTISSTSDPSDDMPRPDRSVLDVDRPRERLRSMGAQSLTRVELLALLIGSGTPARSCLVIAKDLLTHFGSFGRMAQADVAALRGIPGVGVANASRLAAALEVGRRAAAEPVPAGITIRGPADVFRLMGPTLQDLRQEEFHTLLLNTRHRVIRAVFVTRGILDASLIHPREVFRIAVGEGAAGVILVHNHPSGDPAPSSEDRAVTRQLAEAGRALGIPVLDHVVVGRGRYVSLATDIGP